VAFRIPICEYAKLFIEMCVCVCGDDGGYFDERDVKMKERENWDG
jgi:hypothetical protein